MSKINSQTSPLSGAISSFERAWEGKPKTSQFFANYKALTGTYHAEDPTNSDDVATVRECLEAACGEAPVKTPGQVENFDTFVADLASLVATAALPAVAEPPIEANGEAAPKPKKPLKKAPAKVTAEKEAKPAKKPETTTDSTTTAKKPRTKKTKPEKVDNTTTEVPTKQPRTKKTKTAPTATPTPTPTKNGTEAKGRSEEYYIAKSSGKFDPDQIRILRALRKLETAPNRKEVSRDDIKEAVGIGRNGKYSSGWLNSLRELNDQGFIGIYDRPENRGYTHAITATGKKALEAVEKAFAKAPKAN